MLRVMSRSGLVFSALFAVALAAAPSVAFAQNDPEAPPDDPAKYAEELQGYVPGASALEGRIMAPCCWTQTIDIHGSEIANDLRREIRKRLRGGESADTIQASLVDRYGERILGAGAGSFMMLKRWRRRSTGAPAAAVPAGAAPKGEAALDARLDAELRALDD
jgi:cytochrome c-type biogenesis protein CcmH